MGLRPAVTLRHKANPKQWIQRQSCRDWDKSGSIQFVNYVKIGINTLPN